MRCHLQACPNNGLVYGAAGGHAAPHIYSTRRRLMDSYLYADDTVIYSSNVGVKLSFLRWWRRLFFFSTFQPNFEKEKQNKTTNLKKSFCSFKFRSWSTQELGTSTDWPSMQSSSTGQTGRAGQSCAQTNTQVETPKSFEQTFPINPWGSRL